MFKRLEGEVLAMIENVIELTYFMRGSISYDDMMNRTYVERKMISDFLSSRLEAESEKMNPNY